MRKRLAGIAVAGLIAGAAVVLAQAPAAAKAPRGDLAAGIERQLAAGIQVVPKQTAAGKLAATGAANPYTSLLRDPSKVDKYSWSEQAKAAAAARANQRTLRSNALAAAANPLVHDEAEPKGTHGSNDTHATAELVKGFGTAKKLNNRARVLGRLAPDPSGTPLVAPAAEDDGSIPLAAEFQLGNIVNGFSTTGTIGDGPHGGGGDATGDFDFFVVHGSAGQQLTVGTSGALDTVIGLYDDAGVLVDADDDSGPGLSSLLELTIPATGNYYVMVAGYGQGTVFPADPFDSGSGLGVGKEGAYELAATLVFPDHDFYAVDLVAGDVLGASVTDAGVALIVRDPAGRVVFGSAQDASALYPPSSPLPGGGNAVVSYVAPRDGRYTLEVGGTSGSYDITLEAYRPGLESQAQGTTQTLFLDFDGARLNTAIFGGPGVRTLTPLQGFLGRWGLTAADEDKVIDQVIATVRENLLADAKARGTDPRVGLTILNSRDNPDAFGQPNVQRVVVGGTIGELGLDTIGISQFIDPGNFDRQDTAVVLLDTLSDPSGAASLNAYITPASNKIKFVGRALGNVISHEAGHLYGNFHTDPLNDTPDLMDAGGAFPGLFGVGPDNIGGTADDADYDFGEDVYTPDEGLAGTEDTLNTTAWALTKGKAK
ncbi:pre-peptidase C-terminal domain-containing protein [Dactylosporangium salmoneum]|uniref:Peptidase C-terminal archaeal/bacterial domain-containing protein n=1 Tax=Dactylosporangium salmoneum TaxID=53361 RepID=A0ABN3HGU8_9ACTN